MYRYSPEHFNMGMTCLRAYILGVKILGYNGESSVLEIGEPGSLPDREQLHLSKKDGDNW